MPPHIIVYAGRSFADYTDEFVAIPARQIGIAGEAGTEELLRALAVYLSSDFVTYQQFLTCPEWGVDSNRATLDALRALPIPLGRLDRKARSSTGSLSSTLANT